MAVHSTPAAPTRRRFLALGLGSAALLLTAGGIARCGSAHSGASASGRLVLRTQDLPFLRALVPVILADAVPRERFPQVIEAVLSDIDSGLASVSPALLAQMRELFDVTTSSLTRGPLTGVWQGWEQASGEQVAAFLQRWRDSSLDLLRQGHGALLQMVLMAWYGRPEAWAHCGYPGPPTL